LADDERGALHALATAIDRMRAASDAGAIERILDSEQRRVGDDAAALGLVRRCADLALAQLALTGEVASLRERSARLAHDIKGPLTTIVGFSELLEERALAGEDADKALRAIRASALRLADLTSS
jgi:signal transduction histidine kinase